MRDSAEGVDGQLARTIDGVIPVMEVGVTRRGKQRNAEGSDLGSRWRRGGTGLPAVPPVGTVRGTEVPPNDGIVPPGGVNLPSAVSTPGQYTSLCTMGLTIAAKPQNGRALLLDLVVLRDLDPKDVDLSVQTGNLVLRIVHLEKSESTESDHRKNKEDAHENEGALHLLALASENHLGRKQIELLHVLRSGNRKADHYGDRAVQPLQTPRAGRCSRDSRRDRECFLRTPAGAVAVGAARQIRTGVIRRPLRRPGGQDYVQ